MFCRSMAGRLERQAHEVHGGVVFVCLGCVLGHPDGVGLGHTKVWTADGRRWVQLSAQVSSSSTTMESATWNNS